MNKEIDEKKVRIEELVSVLNQASEAYYGGEEEIMSNYEWDAMFDELSRLEKETGYILPDSPTETVGYEAAPEETNGNREAHEYPALSLAKTKDVEELKKWAGDRPVWLSWKLDGLTLVVTMDDGKVSKIVTRGNGTVGTNITFMKDALIGIPKEIPYKGHLVVRGEATISYTDFKAINDMIEDTDEKYANPRNLASGTLGLDIVNIDKVKERRVHFNAFSLVAMEEKINSWGDRMDFLDKQGFITIEREKTNAEGLQTVIDAWTKKVETGEMDIPVDGLVICYDDMEYAATGSVTGHHATRAGLAFKWQDVSAETELEYIEWSCAVSTISPVAVFKPVELEGTIVRRASLCNITEMRRLGIGANGSTTLEVIKANKIIPKCIGVKKASGEFEIPDKCPVCQAKTELRVSGARQIETLHCSNPHCVAKHIKKFTRFVSKQGMDVDGLSIQTIVRFMNLGYLTEFADIYSLEKHQEQIKELEGFGEKSCENLLNAIEKSKKVHPVSFIYAFSIPMIGVDAAKKMIQNLGYQGFLERLESKEGFEDIDGIGPEKSSSIVNWYAVEENKAAFHHVREAVLVENVEAAKKEGGKCEGLTFVITGNVYHYKNRDEFKAYVESQNGTVTGSVSKKTNYLVNNDTESASSKNKKAKELGIPIISEEQFLEMFS